MINRRKFLKQLVGGIAVGAVVRTWPFRVFSFPSELVATPMEISSYSSYSIKYSGTINHVDTSFIRMLNAGMEYIWDDPKFGALKV